jgi:hypothetical protein
MRPAIPSQFDRSPLIIDPRSNNLRFAVIHPVLISHLPFLCRRLFSTIGDAQSGRRIPDPYDRTSMRTRSFRIMRQNGPRFGKMSDRGNGWIRRNDD